MTAPASVPAAGHSVNSESTAGESIRSVLLPTGIGELLLPNSAVAEVIAYQAPVISGNGPLWLLGGLMWRNCRVPLISIEGLLGGSVETPPPRARIAVCNTLDQRHGEIDYIGIVVRTTPRLVQVSNEQLKTLPPTRFGQMCARFEGITVIIPDIGMMEMQVRDHFSTQAA